MPSHSIEQAKTMSAIAHGWEPKGSAAGISIGVAKEFHAADKGHKYGAGHHEGRAMGGVAPGMPNLGQMANPGGVMSQAMNPAGPPMPPQGVAPPMMQPPPMQASPAGPPLSGSSPLARPMKRGGAAVGMIHHSGVTTGPLISDVPGRTDLHNTKVPSGSYVIPADIVSAHGQGNSLAGMKSLHQFFRMENAGHPVEGNPSCIASKFAKGGTADQHIGQPVPVHLAGGEIVVPPDKVHETMQRVGRKKMTLEAAHRAMDAWVVNERKKLRRTLAKLPPPVRD